MSTTARKEKKTTLLSLCREAHISVRQLAKEAHVEMGVCYAVEIGGFCTEEVAGRVLAAFNRLSQQQRTLEDIQWYKSMKVETTLWRREH
jgi:hypothetical protein